MTPTAETVIRTATDDEIASVEEQLRLLFARVRLVWKEAAAAVHPDLQPVGYKIISAIVHRGRMHAGAIADVLEIDKSVVSRQVKHLEALGLGAEHRRSRRRTGSLHRGDTGRDRERRSEGARGCSSSLYGAAAHLVRATTSTSSARLLGRLTSEVVEPGPRPGLEPSSPTGD